MKNIYVLLLLSFFGSGLIYAQEPSTKIELNYGFWTPGNLYSPGYTGSTMLKGFDLDDQSRIKKAQSELLLLTDKAESPSLEGVGFRYYPKSWVVNSFMRFSIEISSNELHSIGSIEYYIEQSPDSMVLTQFTLEERDKYIGLSPAVHFDQDLFNRVKWVSTLGFKTLFGLNHSQTFRENSNTYYYSTVSAIVVEKESESTVGNGGINEWFIRTGLQISVSKKIELGLALSMHRGVWNNYGAYKYRYVNTGANISIAYALK
jgi:hypothetical protein